MFNTTNTATAKKNLSNVARYFTAGVGATKNGLTDFSIVFEYDFKQIVLKFA